MGAREHEAGQADEAARRVIDTHVHVWDIRSDSMRWIVNRPAYWDVVRRDFSWQDLRGELDASGVEQLFLVQACTVPAETQMMLDIASHEPSVLGVVGWASLRSRRETEAHLALYSGSGTEKLVGIRNNHRWTPTDDVLTNDEAVESCRLLAERGLTLDLFFPDDTELMLAARLADRVPEGRYIVDHLGRPVLTDPDAFRPWAAAITALSQHPATYIKFSGWATGLDRTRGEDVRRYIEFAVEEFGSNRVMFGSNWPVALVAGRDYADIFQASLDAIHSFPPSDVENILHRTAEACYLSREQAAAVIA